MSNLKSIKPFGILAFFISLLVFFTPLIHVFGTTELFEFPKMIVVYIVGLTTIFLFFMMLFWKQDNIVLPAGIFTLFIISYIFSTIFSTHVYTSLWGYFTRFNGGLVSVLIIFGLYLLILNLYSPASSEFLLKLATFSLIPISVIGIFQHFTGVLRVYSTLGQPNWLAALIAMLLPQVLYFGIKAPIAKYTKVFWSTLFISAYTCLWFSYSISGILGLLSGLIIFAFLNAKEIKKNYKYVSLLFVISLFISIFNLGTFRERIEDVLLDLEKVGHRMTVVYAQQEGQSNYNFSDPGFIRSGIWKGTINLIVSNPKTFLIGTGPETFPYEFPKFRPESLNYSSEWDFILNKPHNYYLEIFSQNGLVGFVSYALIIYWVIKKKHPYLTPALGAFFVTNIFGWPTVAVHLYFWTYLAFIQISSGEIHKINNIKGKELRYGITLLTLPAYIWLILKFINIYQADVLAESSENLLARGEAAQSFTYANIAVSKNPNEPLYYRRRAKTLLALSAAAKTEEYTDTYAALLKQKALEDLETAYNLNPKNLATLRNSVPLYYFLAINDLTEPAKSANIDPKFLPYAVDYFNKVEDISETDVGLFVLLAKYENRLGLQQDLIESLNKIRHLRPDLLEWHESLRDIDVSLRNPAL